MKYFTLVIFAAFSFLHSFAQDFPGYRSGNHTGVNGVFFNPANIADSRFRFDVNLFSFSTLLGNNQASFKLKNISESFNSDSVKNQIFGKNAGPSSGVMNIDFHGPSLMFNIGRKNAIALTTRARAFVNVSDIDGKLFNKISEDFINDPDLPYTISSGQNMRIAVNGWSEFGVSFARVLSENGPHFFKAGATLKYLAGAANGYMSIDNFNGTIDQDVLLQDVFLKNTSGRISMGFGGVSISDFELEQLTKMKSRGFGGDIGIVYEFRPENLSDDDKENTGKAAQKGYKFKFGVSLLDVGKIKYKKDMDRSGTYDININDGERFSLDELSGLDIDDFNTFFADRPLYFTPAAENSEENYSVSLPTTLQIDADYHLHKGFYLALGGQFSLGNNKKGYNNRTYTSVSLVPRYEGKGFGFYIPINYNELTKMNAGVSLRFGPLFIGSGSVLTALMGKSKQADVHFGLRFGGLK